MWEPSGILSKFILRTPVILHGKTAFRGLKNFPGTKVAVLHGNSITDYAKERLSATFSALDMAFFPKKWSGEPSLLNLRENLQDIEEFRPDIFVAIGGGSVIDGAKIIRTLYEFPYFNNKNRNNNLITFSTKFIAIPTSIGSGAEISSAAVLYNEREKVKEFVIMNSFLPDAILLDPNLIMDSPKSLMSQFIIDALAHIIEGYVSRVNNQLIDVYAEKGLQLIKDNQSFFIDDGALEEQALNLQFASLLGGIVQNHCIVGAAHGIAHQLAAYQFSHTAGIGLCIDAVIEKNSSVDIVASRYEMLAKRAGISDGLQGLRRLLAEIKALAKLEEDTIRLKSLREEILADKNFIAHAISDAGAKGNPVQLTTEFYEQILDSVL